uniref:Uncharacterized protein n=1 Tax=Sexangularia sp. CB-2014 TaxID=1486929 RepID=A0A7S1V6R9_9EUKA
MAAEVTAGALALATVSSLYHGMPYYTQRRNSDAARTMVLVVVAVCTVVSTVVARHLAKRTAVAAARVATDAATRNVRRAGIPVSTTVEQGVVPPVRPPSFVNVLVNVRLALAYLCALAAVHVDEWGADTVSPWAIVGFSAVFSQAWTISTSRPSWWPPVAVSIVLLLCVSWWQVAVNPWQLNTLAATLSTIAAVNVSRWAAKGFLTPADSLAVPTLAIVASACAASVIHTHLANVLCVIPVARVAMRLW